MPRGVEQVQIWAWFSVTFLPIGGLDARIGNDTLSRGSFYIAAIGNSNSLRYANTQVILEEDRGSEIAYVTAAVEPDPPYQGKLALHAVFAEQAKYIVYWD